MIKVLQVGFGYKVGGIQNCILNYYRNMNQNKVHFDFTNMTGHKFFYEEDIKKLGGKIYSIPNEITNPIKCYRELKKLIISNKYDIVHINKNSLACMVAIKAVKSSGAKVKIIHSHSTKSYGGKIADIIHFINKKRIQKYCDYFFSCSTDAAKWMYCEKITNSSKHFIINNAIDIKKFEYNKIKRQEIRKKMNIKDSEIILGHVGRFVPVKNHKFLIDLIKKISQESNNYKLILVGDGDLLPEIKNYAKQKGVEDKVLFLGNRIDTYDLYQIMDIFLLPSFHEGLPIVGIEAQASGLPSIFSESVTKDVKVLEETLFLPIEDSVETWIKNIKKIAKSYNRKKTNNLMNENCYNIVQEAMKLELLYEEFIRKEE